MAGIERAGSKPDLNNLSFDEIKDRYKRVAEKNKVKGEKYLKDMSPEDETLVLDFISEKNKDNEIVANYATGFAGMTTEEQLVTIAYYQELKGLKIDAMFGKKSTKSAEVLRADRKKKEESTKDDSVLNYAKLGEEVQANLKNDTVRKAFEFSLKIDDYKSLIKGLDDLIAENDKDKPKYENLKKQALSALKTMQENRDTFVSPNTKAPFGDIMLAFGESDVDSIADEMIKVNGVKSVPKKGFAVKMPKKKPAKLDKSFTTYGRLQRKAEVVMDVRRLKKLKVKLEGKLSGEYVAEAKDKAKVDLKRVDKVLDFINKNRGEIIKDETKMKEYTKLRDETLDYVN